MSEVPKKRKLKNDDLFKSVVEAVRSSLDINIVRKEIVRIVGKALNADRCFILEYDKNNNQFFKISEEYLSSDKIKSYMDEDFDESIPTFTNEFKKGKILFLNGSKLIFGSESLDINDERFEKERFAIKKYNVRSALAFPLYHMGNFLGDLILHYVEESHETGEEEINLLKEIASQISIAIYQSNLYKTIKKNAQKERLLRMIIETIRSSLDIEEIIKKIVNTVGEILKADRCFIVEYDKINDKFLLVKDEYLSSDAIISYKGIDVNDNVPNFTRVIKNKKTTLVNNEKFVNPEGEEYSELENAVIKNYKVNSLYNVPLLYQDELLGALSISYTRKHFIDESEIELITAIANQIAIAIHQSNLYKSIKKQAQRERLLLDLSEKIRASLDIEEILYFICSETARIFDVQRSAIGSFVHTNNYEDYVIRKEYKQSSDIIGYSDDEAYQNAAHYLTQVVLKEGMIAFDNVKNSNTPDLFKKTYANMGIKSLIGVPIKKGDNIWGILVLSEYNNYRNWSKEEKNLLEIISNQIYIATHQAELYQTVQETAKNEKLLRDIMLSFVKTLEMEDLIKNIVTQTGQLFNSDRCFFIGSDSKTSSNLPVSHFAEYISSPDIKSHTQRVPLPSETSFFVKLSKQQQVICANVDEANLPEPTRKFLADDLSVKSFLIAPVYYGDIRYGAIVLHYVKSTKKFTDEEISIILAIANQAAIVIHQAELYLNIKKQSEREKLLREITEAIRNSIDIEKTEQSIVDTMGKVLGADRCFMIDYDKVNDIFTNVKYEYLSSSDIISYGGIDPQIDFPVFANEIKKGKSLLIQNGEIILDSEDQVFSVERQSLEKYGLNSAQVLPLFYKDELLGIIAIHYVKEQHTITDDEIELLQIISNQIAIAIHQAELYNATLVYAERERISKNIVEILRSSIDKTIIKKLFVKNIGKFFGADRVLFSEYSATDKKYLPADKDSEYLSNPDEKSLIGFDWMRPEVSELINPILDRRELNIFDLEEYLRHNQKSQDFIDFFKSFGIQSSYNFPVLYQQDIIGFFCLDFSGKPHKLSEEDINRIRNMCTQAGIALYHASLYEKAQKCFQDRKSFIIKYSQKIKEPTDEILDKSTLLSQNEFERSIQIEYLNTIINACNQLLDLTKDLSED